jgi:hypothetical protein
MVIIIDYDGHSLGVDGSNHMGSQIAVIGSGWEGEGSFVTYWSPYASKSEDGA